MKYFLPMGLSVEQRESERMAIHRFVRDLNLIRRNHIDRDFANSYVVSNVTALSESYPFVSRAVQMLLADHITACTAHLFIIRTPLASSFSTFQGMSDISA